MQALAGPAPHGMALARENEEAAWGRPGGVSDGSRMQPGQCGSAVVGLGALVPLASRAHQERFWCDFLNCGFGVLGEGTTWVLRFDRFATETPIDAAGRRRAFRSGH